jgi:hypothetical protein
VKVTDEMVDRAVAAFASGGGFEPSAFDAVAWRSQMRIAIEAALLAQPSEPQGVPDGSWLWCKLMDFCKKRRLAPAEYNDLFAIVTEAHKLNTAPAGNGGELEKMVSDLHGIAHGELPDGDGVDTSVALWAERWLRTLAKKPEES